jgi:FkbM family methyltransferase
MNQDFIAQTFLEEHRVIKRFEIEKDLKLFLITELSKDTNFWDIGGCVGNFGIYAGHTGSKVLIFEPDGLTYSSLLRNVFNSNLNNISVFPIALGVKTRLNNFNMKSFEIANAYNSVGNLLGPNGASFKPEFTQNICEFSAATLIFDYDFQIPTHIKIDVDGNELEVLLGFENYLYDPKIKSIFIELDFQNSKSKDCDVLLNKFGFRKHVQQFDSNSYNYVYKRDAITLQTNI